MLQHDHKIESIVAGQQKTPTYTTGPSSQGLNMNNVKLETQRASLPLVLMHVAFITFLSLSMVMSLPTLR